MPQVALFMCNILVLFILSSVHVSSMLVHVLMFTFVDAVEFYIIWYFLHDSVL